MARPSKDKDVFDLKLFAKLDAFCLNICDEKKNIADIKIQGIKFFVTSNSSSSFVSKQLLIIGLKDIYGVNFHCLTFYYCSLYKHGCGIVFTVSLLVCQNHLASS